MPGGKTAQSSKEEGNVHFRDGKYVEAMECYILARSLSPRGDAGWRASTLNLAACCLELQEWAPAVEYCTEVLHYDPANAKALFRRCQGLRHQNDLPRALADIQLSIASLPKGETPSAVMERELSLVTRLLQESEAGSVQAREATGHVNSRAPNVNVVNESGNTNILDIANNNINNNGVHKKDHHIKDNLDNDDGDYDDDDNDDGDEGPPPLEDMSGVLAARGLIGQGSSSTAASSLPSAVLPKKVPVQQKKRQDKGGTWGPALKEGFLLREVDSVLTTRAPNSSGEPLSSSSLVINEVQQAMSTSGRPSAAASSSAGEPGAGPDNSPAWITNDLMEKVASNPKLLSAFADTKFVSALDEMQRDPSAAMKKYRNDKQMTEWILAFTNLLGAHFANLAAAAAPSPSVPTDNPSKTTNSRSTSPTSSIRGGHGSGSGSVTGGRVMIEEVSDKETAVLELRESAGAVPGGGGSQGRNAVAPIDSKKTHQSTKKMENGSNSNGSASTSTSTSTSTSSTTGNRTKKSGGEQALVTEAPDKATADALANPEIVQLLSHPKVPGLLDGLRSDYERTMQKISKDPELQGLVRRMMASGLLGVAR